MSGRVDRYDSKHTEGGRDKNSREGRGRSNVRTFKCTTTKIRKSLHVTDTRFKNASRYHLLFAKLTEQRVYISWGFAQT